MTIGISYWRIQKSGAFNMAPISKLKAIAYSSNASSPFVTHLHLIKDRERY